SPPGRRPRGPVDHPAVLVHDCSLWRLSAPASARSSRLENPVEGLVLYTSHARRDPCRSSTFFRLGFDLNFVINSQAFQQEAPCPFPLGAGLFEVQSVRCGFLTVPEDW